MLEQALAAEETAVADYNPRIRQAEGFGDFGLTHLTVKSHNL